MNNINLVIKDVIRSPTEHELNKLSNLVDGNIDTEYLNHIKTYHGGYPFPDVFDFYRSSKNKESSIVQRFLDITEGINSISHYVNIYNRRIPIGYIPIAYDPGGNLILLNTEKDKSIYFWDHEKEIEGNNIYFAYISFTEFLNGLHAFP